LENCSNIFVLIFKCIEVDLCFPPLHGSKKVGFHTSICGEKSNLKTKSKFKTTNFEYSKKIRTLKMYNMKRQ
jgi:hypothetical protein